MKPNRKQERQNSPSSIIRQAERDRFMKKYLKGSDVKNSPSEIYSKDWKERKDGVLVNGGKYAGSNNIIDKKGGYYGNQEYLYHPSSDDEYYGHSAWYEPAQRKKIGNVTPEDIDNLKRIDREKIRSDANESRNMKKNVVKLNENTLRRIVAESVKNVLSEIDWKTYANAANKRRKQYRDEIKNGIDSDKWDRAQELDNAASRALSDKFGKNLKTWGDNWNGETGDRHVMDADAPWTTGTNAMGPEPTGYYYTSSKDRNWRNGSDEYQNGDYDLYGDIPLDFKNQSEEDKQNNNIGREIDNFTHDRYAYDNEKGWHLKESVEKAVKSVLKEYINKK